MGTKIIRNITCHKRLCKQFFFFKELNIDIRFMSITSEISIKKFDIVQKLP